MSSLVYFADPMFAQKSAASRKAGHSVVTVGFPEVSKVPIRTITPIPYPTAKPVRKGETIVFTLNGEALEQLGTPAVYINGIKSNKIRVKLEPVGKKTRVKSRKIEVTVAEDLRKGITYDLFFSLTSKAAPILKGQIIYTKQTKVLLTAASPRTVQLVPGGKPVSFTLSGTSLDQIAQIVIVARGRPVHDVKATVVRPSSTRTAVTVQAGASAPPGKAYTLLLTTARRAQVEVPASMLAIEVAAAAAPIVESGNTGPVYPFWGSMSTKVWGLVAVPMSFTVSATDPDPNDVARITWGPIPAGLTVTKLGFPGPSAQVQLSWTPLQLGITSICFTTSDDKGNVNPSNMCIELHAVCSSILYPSWTSPANGTEFTVSPGQSLSFTVSATDPFPNDVARITWSAPPEGLTVTKLGFPGPSAQVQVTWTPTLSQLGSRDICFQTADQLNNFNPTQLCVTMHVVEQ